MRSRIRPIASAIVVSTIVAAGTVVGLVPSAEAAAPLNSTSTAVSCTPTSTARNTTSSCTATVSDTSSPAKDRTTPTGTVTWSVSSGLGAVSPLSCTLSAGVAPTASCSTTFTSAASTGTSTVRATYGGDSTHQASGPTSFVITNTKRATSTTASCNATSVPINASTSCTADVTDTSPGTKINVTGSVSWTVTAGTGGGSVSPGTCTLNGGGNCAGGVSFTGTSIGTATLNGAYGGDTDHATATGQVSLTVTKRSTSTSLSCTSPIAIGHSTSCSASVSDTSSGTTSTPSGTVTFGGGTGTFSSATCSLASGSCGVTFTPSATGDHSLTASYGGDTTHAISNTGTTVSVTKRSSSTSASCSPTSVAVNDSTPCSATVTDTTAAPGVTTPTGSVAWTSSNASSTFSPTTCTLGSGTCGVSYTPAAGSEGSHTLTGSYGGDATHLTSSGQATVSATKRTSSTAVSCSSPVAVGVASTCTATVSDTSAGTPVTLGGTVGFASSGTGSFSAASCALASGTCFVTYTPASGTASTTPTITATYSGDTNHETSQSTSQISVTVRSTGATVSCSPASVPVNVGSTCTANVSDLTGVGFAPTGTITFSSGADGTFSDDGECTIAGDSCSVTYTPAPGSASPTAHGITASYEGDDDHAGSSDTSGSVTATTRATSISISCDASVVVNDAASCNVSVSDTSGGDPIVATGTVDLSSNKTGTFSGDCTLDSAGACSVTYTPSLGTVGDHTITASYAGDVDHASAQDQTDTIAATKRASSVSVTCAPDELVVNRSTTCSVTVDDDDAGTPSTPSGSVELASDHSGAFASDPATCTLESGTCSLDYTPAVGSQGSHTITATYDGDDDFSGNSGTDTLVVTKRSTTLNVACVPDNVAVNVGSQCTATLTDTDNGDAVDFDADIMFKGPVGGAFDHESCTPVAGECSVTYTPDPGSAGPHEIGASFPDDTAHVGSTADGFALTATKRAASLSLECDESIAVNAPATCTATASDATAAGDPITPADTVTFATDNHGTFSSGGECSLDETGECSVMYTPAPGAEDSHGITASYDGDADHLASDDAHDAVTATQRASDLQLSCIPDSVEVNSPSTCTASAADATAVGDGIVPSGDVGFSSSAAGSFDHDSCTLDTGSCSVTYTPSTGSATSSPHTVTGTYGGDTDHTGASQTSDITVSKRLAAVDVSCDEATIVVNDGTTCTVTVTDESAGGTKLTPTGPVDFSTTDGGFDSASCVLSSGSCSVSFDPGSGDEGTQTITAAYDGDGDHLAAADDTTTVDVDQRASAVDVECDDTSLAVGESATCTATVTDTSGAGDDIAPTGSVSFGTSSPSSGFSDGATCELASDGTCAVTYTAGSGSTADTPHTVTAGYAGDGDHSAAADDMTSVDVSSRTTSLALDCSPDAVALNNGSTCTATVTDTTGVDSSFVPGGTVSFGGATGLSAASCTLSGGSCSVTYTPGSGQAGSHTIAADYAGDTDHTAATEATDDVAALRRASSIDVSCASPVVANGSSTCTATVSDVTATGSSITPTGSVDFVATDGGFDASSCTLSAGSCSVHFQPSAGDEGLQTVTASYAGDANHYAGEPDTAGDVNPAATTNDTANVQVDKRASGTTVSCTPASVNVNSGTTCTATVADETAGSPPITPTGLVSFGTSGTGGFSASSCSLTSGSCSVTYTPTAAGNATITATYGSDHDHTGSSNTGGVSASSTYAWTGFFKPIDNLPTANTVKAGSAVPVKFSLGGNKGLAVFATGYPTSGVITCNSTAPIDPVDQTVTAGGSSLSYDSSSGQYTYVWKTDAGWKGTCRQLVLKLNDGTYHRADFNFTK